MKLYAATKATVEGDADLQTEGQIAYATDTNELGSYDGATWQWYSDRLVPVNRITGVTTLDDTYDVVFADTDGGAFTVNLPAGVEGTHYKIINCGSSGNDLTVDPNGAEQLYGAGAGVASTLADGEVINIHFQSVEGWY